MHHHFDLSGRQVGIRHACRPGRDGARHRDDELLAELLRLLVSRGIDSGVEYNLDQPCSITQVHEDQPAVIAAPLHPSHHMHGPAYVGRAKLPAHMRSRFHDASLPPTLALEGGGEGIDGEDFAATVLSRWISGSVRKRYSPIDRFPSFNGPNRSRLSFRTGCPTACSIRLTWWVRPSEIVSSIQEFSSVFLTFLT